MALFLADNHDLIEAGKRWPLWSWKSKTTPSQSWPGKSKCMAWSIAHLFLGCREEVIKLLFLSWLPIFPHCVISHVPIMSKWCSNVGQMRGWCPGLGRECVHTSSSSHVAGNTLVMWRGTWDLLLIAGWREMLCYETDVPILSYVTSGRCWCNSMLCGTGFVERIELK